MEEFIETLRLEDGKVQLQPLHRARMERTARDLGFVCPPMPPLEQLCPEPLRKGRVKCRFVYRETIRELSFTRYTPRIIHTFAPVSLPVGYTYSYKSTDREVLNRLKEGCAADEVLLVDSEGRITDCSFANLAFPRYASFGGGTATISYPRGAAHTLHHPSCRPRGIRPNPTH